MKRIFLVLTIAGSLSMAPLAVAEQTSPTPNQSPSQTQGNTGPQGSTVSHRDAMAQSRSVGKAHRAAKTKTRARKPATAKRKPSNATGQPN